MKTVCTTTKMVLALAIVSVFCIPASAQNSRSVLTWEISLPMGDTKDFIASGDVSLRGIGYQHKRFVQDKISVGFYAAWHLLNGESLETISIRQAKEDGFNGDITGEQWRYVNTFPIMANIHLYFGNRRGANGFLGINGGVIAAKERVETGIAALAISTWHLAIAPEVGISIPIKYDFSGELSVKYHYAFKTGGGLGTLGDGRSHSYVTISVGFGFNHGFFR